MHQGRGHRCPGSGDDRRSGLLARRAAELRRSAEESFRHGDYGRGVRFYTFAEMLAIQSGDVKLAAEISEESCAKVYPIYARCWRELKRMGYKVNGQNSLALLGEHFGDHELKRIMARKPEGEEFCGSP